MYKKVVIYKGIKRCIYEGELEHSQADFETLHERIVSLEQQSGQKTEIIFEATDVYSVALKKIPSRPIDTYIVSKIHLSKSYPPCEEIRLIKVMYSLKCDCSRINCNTND